MKKTEERMCVNCHYWKPTNECTAPRAVSLKGYFIRRERVQWNDGKGCPAHRLKIVRSKPAQAVQS